MASIHATTACSHRELGNISSNSGNPAETIKEVMKDALTKSHYGHSPDGTLFSFYVFSAAVMKKELRNYGDELAEFIREQKLGEVLETPAMQNIAYHKDHANKIYVWTVDHVAVAKWYAEQSKTVDSKNWFKLTGEDYNDELDDDIDEDDFDDDDFDDDYDDDEDDLDALGA